MSNSSLKDNLNIQMIHGYSKTTDELLMEWMEQIADNCTDLDKVGTYRAITGQNGINFSEIIHKTLLGSVVYSNAVQSITNLWILMIIHQECLISTIYRIRKPMGYLVWLFRIIK